MFFPKQLLHDVVAVVAVVAVDLLDTGPHGATRRPLTLHLAPHVSTFEKS